MKIAILLALITLSCASIYEQPILKTVVLRPAHHYGRLPLTAYHAPSKGYHGHALQDLYHPAHLTGHAYIEKYTVPAYPHGIYHGPHGVGIYNPKLHDQLEQAYYRG